MSPMSDPEQLPSSEVPAFAEIQPENQLPPEAAAPPPELPARDPFPAFSFWDLITVLGFTVAAIVATSSLALGIAHFLTSQRHVPIAELASSAFVVIGSQIAAYPVVILFMVMLVRNKAQQQFGQAIHWNWPGVRAPWFLLGGIVLALVVDWLSQFLPIPKSLPVDKYFSEITGAYLMSVFGITLAPLLEELVFRGMLYPLMRRTVGVNVAVLFTATAFAFIHGAQLSYAWAPLLSIFVVGVAFTVVRQRTESVASSFLTHCGYNLALFGMLWIGSDHFRHMEKLTN